MSSIENLRDRIDLQSIPFTDRGSRLLLFRLENVIYIRLAERWTKWEQEFGHYRQRIPIVEKFTLLDPEGTPLALETETYPHVAHVHTTLGRFSWTFLDAETLMLRLPSGRFRLRFLCQAENAEPDRRGGIVRGKRSVVYTTNARILRNTITQTSDGRSNIELHLEAQSGNAFLLNITPRLGFNRSIPSADETIEDARQAWESWFAAAPPVLDEYRQQYDYAWWIMRSGLLTTRYYFTREAMIPSKIHYVGVWHWDQFFHALAYRHVNMRLAEDQLRIVLDHQQPSGMLPDAIYDEGLITHLTKPVDEDVTKPPLLAWTVLKLYEISRHHDFLEEVYEPLCRWHQWWMTRNTNGNGLGEYRHPFSSGLDDSPLWDEGVPVVSPDLNTYLVLQQESLARIAELIGQPEDAARFRAGAELLTVQLMDHLWSEQEGVFQALYDGHPVQTRTVFNLLPLWTGRLPEPMVARLIGHLTDPDQFWTEWPLPTVAPGDPKFDAMQMWRGPTWANINYLFVEALSRVGRGDLARQLRRKTLDLIRQHPDIYEYYNPLTGERPPKAAPIFGWTSAVYIDLAIQETRLATGERGRP